MRRWEEAIRQVTPYVPGEQPGGENLIKLNTNENPYPPSPAVRSLLKEMDGGNLRKYPDPASAELIEALGERYGLGTDRIFVGVGSDDVLALCFLTFFNSGRPVLFPDITYSFYKVWAELFGVPYETPALDGEFCIRAADYVKENGGVIFPNPNAPTGLYLPLAQVEEIVKANQDSVVIVDEAYVDFAGDGEGMKAAEGTSAVRLLEKYDNLLVVQTFSKSRSLAGLRIGFAMGSSRLIRALNDVKYSFNSYTMNMPSQLLGAASVRDEAYFKETVARIKATRENAKARFRHLGFSFPDSQANFLFVSHPKVQAKMLFEALKRERIYVRYFDAPRLENYLRVTIGTDEEMERLFEFLEAYLKEG